jgi:hypothetical protein
MFRTIACLALIVVFSCNNTSDQQHADALHKALVDCVTDASLTPEKTAQIRKHIKADEKSARLDSLFKRKFK